MHSLHTPEYFIYKTYRQLSTISHTIKQANHSLLFLFTAKRFEVTIGARLLVGGLRKWLRGVEQARKGIAKLLAELIGIIRIRGYRCR